VILSLISFYKTVYLVYFFSKCKIVFECKMECYNYILSTGINGKYKKGKVVKSYYLTYIA